MASFYDHERTLFRVIDDNFMHEGVLVEPGRTHVFEIQGEPLSDGTISFVVPVWIGFDGTLVSAVKDGYMRKANPRLATTRLPFALPPLQ